MTEADTSPSVGVASDPRLASDAFVGAMKPLVPFLALADATLRALRPDTEEEEGEGDEVDLELEPVDRWLRIGDTRSVRCVPRVGLGMLELPRAPALVVLALPLAAGDVAEAA